MLATARIVVRSKSVTFGTTAQIIDVISLGLSK